MDPRCKGMPLSSFILKPMQRVTRYPLIIKNVSMLTCAFVSGGRLDVARGGQRCPEAGPDSPASAPGSTVEVRCPYGAEAICLVTGRGEKCFV